MVCWGSRRPVQGCIHPSHNTPWRSVQGRRRGMVLPVQSCDRASPTHLCKAGAQPPQKDVKVRGAGPDGGRHGEVVAGVRVAVGAEAPQLQAL